MAKMRVYELANSLGIEVERAIRLLQQVERRRAHERGQACLPTG